MNKQDRASLWLNLSRLAFIATVLLSLKLFTYFFVSFLPVFTNIFKLVFFAFLPFSFAIIISFLLEPLVIRLIKVLRLRRAYASFLTLILTLSMLGLFIFTITSRLYTELADLAVNLPDYNSVVSLIVSQIESMQKLVALHPQLKDTLFTSAEEIFKSFQGLAKSASVVLLGIVSGLPGFFIVVIVSIIATLMISSSYPQVKRVITNFFPTSWHNSAHIVIKDLGTAVVGFLRAQFILVSVTALGVIIGLLVLGNPYAVTIGVLAGILDIIPIIGPGLLFVPWVIILIVIGNFSLGIKVLILWLIVTVIRQLLEPKIMSHNIGLHPLPTLISMYAGLKLIGGVGLVIGPVLLIIYEALRKAGVFKHRF